MSEAFAVKTMIETSAEGVWAVMTDWANAPKWMNGVDAVVAHGPLEVGTELTFTARGKARPSEIVALDPGRSFTLQSVQGGVTANYVYVVAPLDGSGAPSANVSLVADCETSGVWKLLGPLLRLAIRRTDRSQLERLKELVDGSG